MIGNINYHLLKVFKKMKIQNLELNLVMKANKNNSKLKLKSNLMGSQFKILLKI